MDMRRFVRAGAVLGLAGWMGAVGVGCDDDDTGNVGGAGGRAGTSGVDAGVRADAGGSGGSTTAQDAAVDAAPQATLTDQQVATVLNDANAGEIAAGTTAGTKGTRPDVKQFAADMVTEHQAAQARLTAIQTANNWTPQDSPERQQLLAANAQTAAALAAANPPAFDDVYIDSQITAHQSVLTLLDTKLIPSAQNPALKNELTIIRAAVQTHLQHAKSLKPESGVTPPTDGGAADGPAGTAGADGGTARD